MGVNIDENSEEWKKLVQEMQQANLSVLNNDLGSIRQKLTDIKKLTKDIELGSIISDEDYEKLLAYNAALAESFVLTADGYMYVGNGNPGAIADDIVQNQLTNIKTTNSRARGAASSLNTSVFSSTKWDNLATGLEEDSVMLNAAINLKNSGQNILDAIGVSATKINDLITALQSTDENVKKQAREE
jgi:hypothetical protein